MTSSPGMLQMMNAHVNLNIGVYFDNLANLAEIAVATSRIIPDIYWNYAYTKDGTPFDDSRLSTAISNLRAFGRSPAVWQPSDQSLPKGWIVGSQEAWMWLQAQDWSFNRTEVLGESGYIVTESSNPSEEMRQVFEDAYSSGEAEGDVGYFQLPKEYGDAYGEARGSDSTVLRQFSGYLDGQCVCIGTAAVWNGFGGLYSVATRHGFRRRGFAVKLSRVATDWAIKNGATGVMLQTEADSAVESLYQGLGYRRSHIGLLLVPEKP